MKWTLHPKNENLTTSLPLTVVVEEWEGKPSVYLEGVGELKLKPQGKNLKSEFYLALPGEYKLEVKDSITTQSYTLNIAEHKYLDFTNEFGFFLVLFLIAMGGIIIWTRKIMQK